MPMMRGELVMVDTNVLLASTNTVHEHHGESRKFLLDALEQGIHLATCGQILREYLVVATRPVSVNGLGLSTMDALHNIGWLRKRQVFLEETEYVHDELIKLVGMTGLVGKNIHDANIVAVMYASGIHYLATFNTQDFSGFPGLDLFTPGQLT